MTPEQRSQRARVAAYSMHAAHDPHDTTQRAREALWQKYRALVDPHNELNEAERDRRARALMQAALHRGRLAALKKQQLDEQCVADNHLADELLAGGVV